jgi:hypothetical protein
MEESMEGGTEDRTPPPLPHPLLQYKPRRSPRHNLQLFELWLSPVSTPTCVRVAS